MKGIALSTGNHYAFKCYSDVLGFENVMISHSTKKSNILSKLFSFLKIIFFEIPRKYDIYFCESCFYYPVLARKLGIINGKIINVCCSPIYYNLAHNRHNFISKKILLWLLKDVDMFVCQGEYVCNILKKLGVEKPSIVTYTFISPERIKQLDIIKKYRRPDPKTLMTIATHDWYYKGVDKSLKIIERLAKKDSSYKLYLVIRNIDLSPFSNQLKMLKNNVIVTEDALEAFKHASIYVHPSRGDVFPVSPQEAAYLGMKVICSKECGSPLNKYYLEKDVLPIFKKLFSEKYLAISQ